MDHNNVQQNEEVSFKQRYFTDKMPAFVQLLVISAIIVLILLFMISYIYFKEPRTKYFFTYSNGQVFQSQPLDHRLYSDAQIKDWAAQAAIRAFDYNFLNYKHQLMNSRSFFTNEGYATLMDQISQYFFKMVVQKKLFSKLSLCDVATIKTYSPSVETANKFIWVVSLPVYMEFRNNTDNLIVAAKILTRVERVSDLDYLGGLAISSISVTNPVATKNARPGELPVCNNNFNT